MTSPNLSDEMFRLAVESCPSGMIMTDADGIILLVNAEVERLFGYWREELLGKSIDILVPAPMRAAYGQHRSKFTEHPTARRLGTGRDLYGVCKDGRKIPVEVGLNSIRTSDGFMVLSAISDISQRKLAAQALAARSEELQRSNEDLAQFAYVASHDLQEPLRLVATYTELLSEHYKGTRDKKAEKYIKFALDGAKRMQQLIKDLLAYSRAGTQGTVPVEINSEIAVKRALDSLKVAIDESHAEIICDKFPAVTADETQLTQVFQNLIGNALKFHGDRLPHIHIGAEKSNGNWLFRVEDNGIGIDKEYGELIFQMFQRLHGRAQYDGNGIGLAITKKIVERHGGRICSNQNWKKDRRFISPYQQKRAAA